MSVKERLKEFIKHIQMSERAFCLSIGVGTAYINSIKVSIQPDKIDRITKKYPTLNIGWLMTGDGSMLNDFRGGSRVETLELENSNELADENALLKQLLSTKDQLIESLTRENSALQELLSTYKKQLDALGRSNDPKDN